jgi:ketosteroid isomerase-like protein
MPGVGIAMSQENVELVRRGWDVFTEGMDQGNWTAVFDEGLFAPECTLTPPREVPGSKTYVGREGFIAFLQEWTEDFLDWRIWPEEIIDAGDDRVVAVVCQSARGKESGAAVQVRFGVVYAIEDGQIIDQRHYLDLAEALEVAGVSS